MADEKRMTKEQLADLREMLDAPDTSFIPFGIPPALAKMLLREVDALRAALESLRAHHRDCEDPWYSCAKHEGYIGESDVTECTCGADAQNARIDAALKATEETPNG